MLAEFGKNIELMRKCRCVGVSLWNCLKFKLRIEAAYRREVAELRKCLGAALEVVDSTAEKLGVIYSVKSCEEYKMWRKVLESTKEAKDEGK